MPAQAGQAGRRQAFKGGLKLSPLQKEVKGVRGFKIFSIISNKL